MLLCIDDNPAILEYERSLFENSGYIVITTTSPRQGLQLATMSRFDVVVLDYHMPEMSGHQVAREIRRTRPDTSLVMVSGSEIPQNTRTLIDAWVPKDAAIGELLAVVDSLFDGSSYDTRNHDKRCATGTESESTQPSRNSRNEA